MSPISIALTSSSSRSGTSSGSASTCTSRVTCERTPPALVPADSPTSSTTTAVWIGLVEAHLLEIEVVDLPADRIDLVVLEDRRVRRLLPRQDDVEDRVQPVAAGQHAAQLALGHADRVRLVPAPVEDAGDQAVLAQPARLAGAALLALLHLETDPFAGHTGGEV